MAGACCGPDTVESSSRGSDKAAGGACGPDSDASCCASFYAEPAVHFLLGDSYHPGGLELTRRTVDHMALADGVAILDVACGQGTSLDAILQAFSNATAVGMDVASVAAQANERLSFCTGDVHEIPFADASFGAVLCECAVSTFADQPKALAEMFRVLAPGGTIGVTDMLANGKVPDELSEWVQIGTCLSHALSLEGYQTLLIDAGFEIVHSEDSSWALADLLRQIKRRLLTAAVAKVTGSLPPGVDIDVKRGKKVVRAAQATVADGIVGYGMVVARKPPLLVSTHGDKH